MSYLTSLNCSLASSRLTIIIFLKNFGLQFQRICLIFTVWQWVENIFSAFIIFREFDWSGMICMISKQPYVQFNLLTGNNKNDWYSLIDWLIYWLNINIVYIVGQMEHLVELYTALWRRCDATFEKLHWWQVSWLFFFTIFFSKLTQWNLKHLSTRFL